jgi:hypothetical protein
MPSMYSVYPLRGILTIDQVSTPQRATLLPVKLIRNTLMDSVTRYISCPFSDEPIVAETLHSVVLRTMQ